MKEDGVKFVAYYLEITKPLHYVQRFLSLTSYKNVDGFARGLSKTDRLYGYVLMSIIASVVALSLLGKFWYNYTKHSVHLTTTILDLIITCLIATLVIISIRLSLSSHAILMNSFFSNIRCICVNLQFSWTYYGNSKAEMFGKTAAVTIAVFGLAIVDVWAYSNLKDVEIVACHVYYYWLIYYDFIIFLEIDVKIELLKQMFLRLNQVLAENLVEFRDEDEITVRSGCSKGRLDIGRTAITHFFMCELISTINKLHGVQILAIYSSLILVVLSFLDKGIILVQNKSAEFTAYVYYTLFIHMTWCLSFLIVGIIISSRCHATLRYANDSRVIAQKLLVQKRPLPNGINNDNEIFKRQLRMLTEIGEIPTFSAAGFFSVDFTLIYEVMGAVTTYFIVLLQFAGVTS